MDNLPLLLDTAPFNIRQRKWFQLDVAPAKFERETSYMENIQIDG